VNDASHRLSQRHGWLSGQRDALEEAINGAPLESSLGVLVQTAIEALGQDTRAAFYLANAEGTALHHLVGMSDDYAAAVDGFVIGADSLACGLATHAGQSVLTADVMTDARWAEWRWMAERFGYRGCWSFPIRTSTGSLVGTFAVYSREPREATPDELELASLMVGTAGIIISHHMESTARKQAEAALRESEARYRTLFNSIDEGFCVIEMLYDEVGRPVDYRFLEVNPGFEAQSGLTSALGRTVRELVPNHENHWFEIYGKVAETGESVRFENIGAGMGRWFDVFAFRLGEPEDRRVAVLFTDITERKRAVEMLLESDRRKSEFLAMLAHELRNPLAPILSSAQLLGRVPHLDPSVTRAGDVIERQATHMARLVDDLLDVSRINRGKLELDKQSAELGAILGQAIEITAPLCAAKDQRVGVELPPEPIWLEADAARITQVFGNLLSNASRYSDYGGPISISVGRERDHMVVRVRDTGVGIPSDKLESIFELFEQVDQPVERKSGGLGVGLSLVKRLVEMHDGSVRAHSDGPGTGSEFIVCLPILADVPPVAEPSDTRAASTVSRRILVVDDNYDAAQTLAMLLELMGHEVAMAHDGVEAVARADTFAADVILLDIGMPRLDGYEAARLIRERHGPAVPKLVALTGWGHKEDCRRSRAAGFDAHLVKPVEMDQLTELLEALS
jgi:PAS domain S-box-containing protein